MKCKATKKTINSWLFLFIIFFLFISSCGNQSNSLDKNVSNSENSTQNQLNSNLNNGVKSQTSEMKESKFEKFKYSYKKENQKTVALFVENFLPRDDNVVVGAIRHVINKSYGEDAIGKPSLQMHNGINKIHIDNKNHNFFVNLVKEDSGEVHSLVIDRELK